MVLIERCKIGDVKGFLLYRDTSGPPFACVTQQPLEEGKMTDIYTSRTRVLLAEDEADALRYEVNDKTDCSLVFDGNIIPTYVMKAEQ